jgi:predicted metal-dependent enzyme (double-stranded beta helix superfamily)
MDDQPVNDDVSPGMTAGDVTVDRETQAELEDLITRYGAVQSITVSLEDQPEWALRVFVDDQNVVGVRSIEVPPGTIFTAPAEELRGLVGAVGLDFDNPRFTMMYCSLCDGTLGYGKCTHG